MRHQLTAARHVDPVGSASSVLYPQLLPTGWLPALSQLDWESALIGIAVFHVVLEVSSRKSWRVNFNSSNGGRTSHSAGDWNKKCLRVGTSLICVVVCLIIVIWLLSTADSRRFISQSVDTRLPKCFFVSYILDNDWWKTHVDWVRKVQSTKGNWIWLLEKMAMLKLCLFLALASCSVFSFSINSRAG